MNHFHNTDLKQLNISVISMGEVSFQRGEKKKKDEKSEFSSLLKSRNFWKNDCTAAKNFTGKRIYMSFCRNLT